MAKLELYEIVSMMESSNLKKEIYGDGDKRSDYNGKNGILMVVKVPDKGTVYGQFVAKWPDGTIHRLCTSPGKLSTSNMVITITTNNSIYNWKRNVSLAPDECYELEAYIKKKLVAKQPNSDKKAEKKKLKAMQNDPDGSEETQPQT